MSEPERQVILKWMTRTEMVRKWVIDIDKIIIEYGDMTLHGMKRYMEMGSLLNPMGMR